MLEKTVESVARRVLTCSTSVVNSAVISTGTSATAAEGEAGAGAATGAMTTGAATTTGAGAGAATGAGAAAVVALRPAADFLVAGTELEAEDIFISSLGGFMTATKRKVTAINFDTCWGGKMTKVGGAGRFLKYEAYLETPNFFLLPGIMEEGTHAAGPVISHVGADTQCGNIKSLRAPRVRCKNPATHGAYCGIHYKTPRPWAPGSPKKMTARKQKIAQQHTDASKRIVTWWRKVRGLYLFSKRGPAFYDRTCPVNDTDFFSTDKIVEISKANFFSYRGEDNHVYAFDIRSIHSLLENARQSGHPAENPYNRAVITNKIKEKVSRVVKLLKAHGCTVSWAPLTPDTPEQQFRMKVVDVFHIIDELNYYSSPDWFLTMDVRAHRKFYTELHDIWVHRAGLSIGQKNLIVPSFPQRIFRQSPWTLHDASLETFQKVNLNTIRLFIKSAEDRNDRILGAMYVVTAMTLVSPAAREAYPWLYESVEQGPVIHNFPPHLGGWLAQLLGDANLPAPPPLQLPPPHMD